MSCPASARTCATITFRAPRWLVGKKGVTFNDRGRGLGLAQQVLHYALFRQGMLAMTGAPIRAFVRSREGLEAPDLMLGWIPMLTEPSPRGPRISRQSGLTLYAHAMRPESKGHVHITVADARRPPAINFNFLSSPPDAELTVRAVRIARSIMTAPAMSPFQMSELAPGADRTTDDEILDWVKKAAEIRQVLTPAVSVHRTAAEPSSSLQRVASYSPPGSRPAVGPSTASTARPTR